MAVMNGKRLEMVARIVAVVVVVRAVAAVGVLVMKEEVVVAAEILYS